MTVILGAGLAGLSASYHLNHECEIFEKNSYSGGHIYSHLINGFTWDEGPHVSFTKHQYVKDLFAESLEGNFLEFPVQPTNYYKGHWIPHPAQANLYALPEPIRTECLNSFLESRNLIDASIKPDNYDQWITRAFGETFAKNFPRAYTFKYWTTYPENLTTDWVGERVYFPEVEVVKNGFKGPAKDSKHYITSIRYPKRGGYYSFADKLKKSAKIHFNKNVETINLKEKKIVFKNGESIKYSQLINTIPLPDFIRKTKAPPEVLMAADKLVCSEVLLLNFVVNHPATIHNQWFYVYDIDKFSCRINFTNLLSPNNGIVGQCGIQVEVYFSKYRPQEESLDVIINKVKGELLEMGLIKELNSVTEVNTNQIKYANVIFDHNRREALNTILNYLEPFGLQRESDDLEPMTNWEPKLNSPQKLGEIILAGRFGQWNYYWTDDCVLRGKFIGENILQ